VKDVITYSVSPRIYSSNITIVARLATTGGARVNLQNMSTIDRPGDRYELREDVVRKECAVLTHHSRAFERGVTSESQNL
jgi:hypothetical protein